MCVFLRWSSHACHCTLEECIREQEQVRKHLRECVRVCLHAHVHARKSDKKSEGGSESKHEGEHEMARGKQEWEPFFVRICVHICVCFVEGGGVVAKTSEGGHFSCEDQIDTRQQYAHMHTWPQLVRTHTHADVLLAYIHFPSLLLCVRVVCPSPPLSHTPIHIHTRTHTHTHTLPGTW